MKHKLFTLLLAVLASVATMNAEIYNGTCGSYMSWELNTTNKTLTFTGGGSMTDYSNASSVPWYSYRSLIEHVDFFSNNITSIGSYAFYNCTELKGIIIPSSITSIGNSAFGGCTNLKIVHNYTSMYMVKGGYTNSGITANAEEVHNYYTWTGTCGDSITWSFHEPTLTISGHGNMDNWSYSESRPWDNYDSSLSEIIVEEGIEQLGTYAFCELTNVTSVSLPNSLKNINKATFMRCYNLQSINIPNTIERINQYGFYMCKTLKSISIPSAVTYIGEDAFYECDSLEAVHITDLSAWCNMEIISNPLRYAHNLYLNGELVTELVIPNNVKKLNDYVFYNCHSITSVTTPMEPMLQIARYAFSGCDNISHINWNFKRKYLGTSASESPFYFIRSQIKSITYGEEVSMIPAFMCYGMTNLTSVVIPNSVTTIEASAFAYCSNLSSITIPNSVTNIEANAFSHCQSLPIINNLRYADTYVVEAIDKTQSSFTFKEGTKFIGDTAFNSCNNLISISIPEELIGIAACAFAGCDNLDSVNWKAKRCQVSSHGDKVFPKNITVFVFGDEVEEIPAKICYGMTSLSSITLGANVKNIGSKAFYNCFGIKNIYVPSIEVWCNINFADADANPLTTESMLYINDKILRELEVPSNTYIDKYAFMDCSTLTSISIPPSISAIGDSAFYNCNTVTSIFNYSIYPQTIDGNVLYNIDRSGCTLYVPNESMELYRETNVWNTFLHIEAAPQRCGDNLTWEVVNDTLFISGSGEMWDYSYSHPWSDTIVAISLPEGLTRIGEYAFYNCSRLESVVIPASVTSIGSRAWSGCYMIQSVACYAENPPMVDKNDLPNVSDWCYLYVPELYLDAYKSDRNWSEYENIRAIGNCGDHLYWQKTNGALTITGSGDMYDFNTYPPVPWGSGVTAVTLSEGVTSIGTYAFMHEYGLHSIELPNSLSKIAVGAFVYSGLQTVKLPENLTQIEGYVFSQCTQLTSIYNAALVPQTIETNVFNGVNTSSCTLYVPEESIEAYRAADVWNSFANILPIPELPEEPIDTLISVAQAIEIGQALENHAQTEMMYTIVGYVSVLAGQEDDFERYNNQTYWITDERGSTAASAADGAFEVFRGIASEEVHLGDKVSVYGVISRYDEIIESVRPQVTILEKSPVEEPAEVVQLPYSESFLGDMGLFSIHDVEKDTLPYVWQTTPAYGMKASGYYSGPHNTESWLISPKISLPAEENINMSFETCLNYASDDYNSCAVKIFVDNTWSDLQFNKWPAGHSWAYDTVTTSLDTYAGNEIRVAFVYRSSTLYSNATWEVRNLVIKQEEIQDTIPTTQYSGSCGENLTWDLTNGILTISGHGEMPAFTASNPAPWYIYAAAIQSVILTNGVTNIGQYAFYNCTALTSVSMTSSVNSIGYAAFAACSNLTSIEIPNGVTNIGQYAFSSCSHLTNITLPNTITKIDTATFNGCSSLTSIEIPNSVKSIAYCAFFDCYNLRKCVIPEGVTTIGDMVFCSSGSTIHMESLTLPSTIISIGDYLFCEDDDNWPDIYVPCGEMERFQQMLNNNDKVQYAPLSIYRITIPESERGYTTVSNYRSNYTICDDIDVQINATPYKGYKFVSWTDGNSDNPRYIKLTRDTTMEAVYDYQLTGKCGKDNALTWTYNPETKALAITGEGELTDDNYPYGRFMDSLTIGEGITRIGGGDLYAFGSCANLKSITIPSSLTSIDGEEFGSCPNLSSVHISNLGAWCTIQFAAPSSNPLTAKWLSNDVVVGADLYLNGELVTDLVIPDNITTIGDFSFLYCNSLTSVKIPDSVTQIGRSAFLGCQNMRSVIIGNNVTDINNLAFVYCSGLKSITCKAATPPVFTIVESMYSADLHPFEGDDTTHCALFVPAESVEAYKAADGWRAFKHIYPLQAEEVTVNEPTAEPTTNSVVIEWPQNEDAETYTIVIKKVEETIYTLEFDASGQLTNIAYAVPARNSYERQAHAATQTSTGWQYTIGGLEVNTDYTYTVVARRNDNSEVYNTTIQFRTQATTTDFDQIINERLNSIKLLRNGQILIPRGDRTYTLTGQEVK